ncbi:MAG: HAD-IA family hydrolase, partial [Eubacteriales bacterium]|nr:HAD-IA family hydrolase [Eubacteriales bacterium]
VMKYLTQSKFVTYFDYIICGDMVKNGKPEPEIYSKACSELGVSPKNVLVLEDSKNGILAGYSAGCNVIMVIDIEEHYEETKDMIITKIKDYKEVEKYI